MSPSEFGPRLLLDQNLSPRLTDLLEDLFPGITHVRQLGLERATDPQLSSRAAREGFVIVSKDGDFHQRSFTHGFPPKVIWVRLGNCSTAQIEAVLRSHEREISAFLADPVAAFLALA